ncbi:unnamed protein product [Miscanthus lutarioriparius]|uniref:Cns1/TTC4 wheel domain-containing protein n=1 Tax=Miscanthus lutarioriparius TaxID=422564 RepID=A0A811N2U2_9POAL|nr:unnamed protein product [Miscanthus lutarioriparius]
MALLMEPGAEPLTESEQADLAGIAAIKESAAREFKEQGNQFVRMGRKHYAEAVSCYTKAIAQMEPLSSLDASAAADASVLFANRAHVNLLLGNHRRALDEAEQAIRLSPSSVKITAPSFLDLAAAMEMRGVKLGKAAYQELTGVKKPKLDEQGVLHWPVLLLYPEAMSSDFIEDFPDTDTFSPHLDIGLSSRVRALMDGFEGNGGGYGNDDGTRDFFSQPEHSSAFNLYSDPPAQFPSSSSINAQRAGLSSLDLNSNGEAWPGMGRYENLLRYGQDEADGEGGFSPSPVRVCASGRTLGVWTARSGGGGGGMAGHAGLNSGAPRAPRPPPLSGSGTRGSSSTAPSGSVPVVVAGPILRQLIRQPWRMTTSTWKSVIFYYGQICHLLLQLKSFQNWVFTLKTFRRKFSTHFASKHHRIVLSVPIGDTLKNGNHGITLPFIALKLKHLMIIEETSATSDFKPIAEIVVITI